MVDNKITILDNKEIQSKIYTIRGLQVMLDRDLAELYGVETRVLNQAVKRNIKRFPDDFMFQLSFEEFNNWRSQFVISNKDKMGLRRPPYVFTEQGVSMLSAVLKSKTAIDVSVVIIRAFIQMKYFLSENANLFNRVENIEQKQLLYKIETDQKIDKIFKALEDKSLKPKQGIFFNGQIFDAYIFISDLIKRANKSLLLIDNFVDETVLSMLSKRKKNCKATIYTKNISNKLKLDIKKHNDQYPAIDVKVFKDSHDRFLIIDNKDVYHIGASLKDLGKKWFAFSKIKINVNDILRKL